MISRDQFKQAAGLSDALADKWHIPLTKAVSEYTVYTPLVMAHIIAQIGHESAGFTRLEENLNYSADRLYEVFAKYFTRTLAEQYARKPMAIANRVYANRIGNGSEGSGDGWKYRGSGLIQLTGKTNHLTAAAGLGINLDRFADLLRSDPDTAARASVWWLWKNGVIAKMEADDVNTVTRAINGGLNGLDDRKARLARAKGVLC